MNQPRRILIADDEPLYRNTTAELLRDEGFECVCVEDAADAISVLNEHHFDLILSDLNMPGNLKLELLREGRAKHSHVPMIVVTGVPSIPSAIESVRLGIADYLLKPVRFEELLASVQRALQHPPTPAQTAPEPSPNVRLHETFPEIIGESPAMLELLDIVERVASSNTNVLITGESGTGKEVIARAIHHHSPRRDCAIQVIDCTSIPEPLFESVLFGHIKGSFTGAIKDQIGLLRACDGGTAFFDELGELPAASQAKLLRVIQEQTFTPVGDHKPIKVDTRFICATNLDLQAEVDAGRFRQDLFYRLAVIHIELPPLRDRGDDVILLAEAFRKHLRPTNSTISGFSPEALECFRQYRWPGNIREMRNVIERAFTLARGDTIEPADLPAPLCDPTMKPDAERPGLADASRDEALDTADRAYLTELLEKHQGVIASAARQAGLSRQGMNKLLKRHGIHADDYR
ncbi:sigma-54-dependent transcriptional regulator [Allorhodopirellula solitaria]|uniref:Transcriptional regulatory protein ZraR n=1 Tax=Allorhodopirellula solitaria TaxID=2527987 RepID=A0A5C5Y182_9BACT|nr:sigma-54 dependent transcriptional regulator [Allorhodopirellula solitaria]TWT67362.1 Transcriptional regulatory protein ZraR [Allorhodopirellula solitaria]